MIFPLKYGVPIIFLGKNPGNPKAVLRPWTMRRTEAQKPNMHMLKRAAWRCATDLIRDLVIIL